MNPQISNDEALYPIAVLIDELKHEDVAYRLNAIKRLSTIALALGVERAREELIPFLDESIEDEDEVLLALAEELGNMVDYIGGAPFAHHLFGPLENLAAVEETVVRDKAVESLCKVVDCVSFEQAEHYYLPLVKKLSGGDWFTSRTSACGLYAAGYLKLPPTVLEDYRKMFATLVKDETPMVRRAAALNLAKLVKKVPKDNLINELIPLFNLLAADDQDSVRLLTVDCVIAIAECLSHAESRTNILNSLRSLYTDKSWRVRYVIAEKFVKLASSVGKDVVSEELIGAFVHLLKDPEAEVRTAACSQIPGFCAMLEPAVIMREIMPSMKELVVDGSQHVRSAIALQISSLAPIIGKENTIDHLVGMFLQCLKDEFSEVRLNIISKLEGVNQVIGVDLLSRSLFPAIVELAEDKQWRVRLAIIEFIPLLAKQLGVKFFDEKLGDMCMGWLVDPIFSIREAAALNLRKLTEVFGVDWSKSVILPKILAMGTHAIFTCRLTTLFSLSHISHVVTPEIIKDSVLPTVINLTKDPIPNIRFNAAKSLESITAALRKTGQTVLIGEQVKPALQKMLEDTDADCRFFGQKALAVECEKQTIMHLMYHLDAAGNRCYTLKKTAPDATMTRSAHPARFSPDDKYSRHRVTLKKRFGILMTQQPAPIY